MSRRAKALLAAVGVGLAAAVGMGVLIQWLPGYLQQQETESYKPEAPAPAAESGPDAPTAAEIEAAQRARFADLLAVNPDVVGWISIAGTTVDLPVMQTDNNSYYLKHALDGSADNRGVPFVDYECDIKNGRHIIIYGHNMGVASSERFSSLQHYRDPDYYAEHPTIQLDTLYESTTWKIVAVYAITTRESDGDVFHFNEYTDFADDAAEQVYLDEVAKRAFYTTGDYAHPDERLLTLSTCTYEMDDARMILLARPLREGESASADTVTVNPDPLLPARWPSGA